MLAALLALLALGISAWIVRADAAGAGDVDCPGVELAPRLASDRGTPATQALDGRGRYVPIVMVHGWTSRATHSRSRTGAFSRLIDLSDTVGRKPPASRSLVGQLQKIPGAAVYTFDYHEFSARWVTDEHLGPALGEAIDCLYEKSGEKVIVVGHSMGGLIARHAVTNDASGGGRRADHVSTVVTFGTPQLGSHLARLAAGVIESTPELVVLRTILADCGRRTAREVRDRHALRHPARVRQGVRHARGARARGRLGRARGSRRVSKRRHEPRRAGGRDDDEGPRHGLLRRAMGHGGRGYR